MKRNSKILAFVIAFAMVMSLVVIPVSADDKVNIMGEIKGIENNVITAEGCVKAPDGEEPAWVVNYATATYNSDGSISITERKNQAVSGLRLDNLAILSGHTYEISCEIKADRTKDDVVADAAAAGKPNKTNYSAQIYLTPANNNGKVNETPTITGQNLTYNQWVKVTTTYTAAVNASGTGEYGMNWQLKVGQNDNASYFPFSIKNMSVVDVTVDPTELKNSGFEDGTAITDKTQPTTALTENYSVTEEDAYSGKYSFRMVAKNEQSDIRYTGLKLEDGAYYRASVMAKLAPDSSLNTASSSISVTRGNAVKNVNPTLNKTDWKEISTEFKVNLQGSTSGVHFGPKITKDAIVYVDDFKIEKINVNPCTVKIDMDNNATGVSLNPTIKYTFSNSMPELTADNFVVSGGIIPEVVKNSDGSYSVTLAGLANATTYTITLTNVKDIYSQTVENVRTFTTEGFTMYGFESDDVNSHAEGVTCEKTQVAGEVYDGEFSLKVTTNGLNGAGYDARFHNAFKGVEIGKKYIISFYAKAAEGSTNTLKVYVSKANITSGNSVDLGACKADYVDIVDNEWRKVTTYIAVKANTDASAKTNLGVHMGAVATEAGTYYVDNFEIHEVSNLDIDENVLSVANKNKDNGLELTLYSATAKTVYLAAAKYNGGKLADIKLDTVELTDAGTKTATLNGVTDEYKIFVWDGNFAPLNNVLSLSDF